MMSLEKVEFTSEDLSEKAFEVYSNSDIKFYKNTNEIYFWSIGSENVRNELGNMINVEIFLERMYQLKAIERVTLENMPYDKYVDGVGFIHATGDEVKLENGDWVIEYEDDIIEDAPGCIYSQEQDEKLEEDYNMRKGKSR